MSEPEREPGVDTADQVLQIDALCDRFEDACKVGDPMSIAGFLRDAGIDPATASPALVRELEKLEAAYRTTPPKSPAVDTAALHIPGHIDSGDTQSFPGGPDSPSIKPEPASELIGGKYTLLEMIGEGGMGSVYLARQSEPVKRDVALKLIKAGLDSKTVLARFDAERQALALMDHPNIARVYDGGTTAAGQPYFVMELVNGVPLTKFCDQRRLPVPARLELFVQVCQAVQHAHQKGIIHRDLKPGNVLVTEVDGRPTPKVIDFGVAKATEQRLTDLSYADTGMIVGTPAYMSPEQADPSSLDIDTRTDVYALGVMLYELLTGSPPHDAKQFKRAAILEMLRMVREVEPARPSTKLSTADDLPNIAANRDIEPAKLARLLRGELDCVVMKALEKDRTRRYDTANGLARDLQRYLADEVVEARPPSRGYRLRKFVRRNKGQVTAVTLVLLTLIGGIVGTSLAMVEADKQAKEANRLAVEEGKAVSRAKKSEGDAIQVASDLAGEKRKLITSLDEANSHLSNARVLAAALAWERGDVVEMRESLRQVPTIYRNWEWNYLMRQMEGSQFSLCGHTDCLNSASFSPDGMRVLTASDDKTARVWDARTGATIAELKGHTQRLSSASFSPDGMRVLTTSGELGVGVWDSPRVWDARTGVTIAELKGHTGKVISASFSPDGLRVLTASKDKTARVWDARTGVTVAELKLKGHPDQVSSPKFSPDGSRVLTMSGHNTACVWDARTGVAVAELKDVVHSDGSRVLRGSANNQTARVWDVQTGATIAELKGQTDGLQSALFSPDGSCVLTSTSKKNTARLWDARTGVLIAELKFEFDVSVSNSWFSPDGLRVLSLDEELRTARVWDARTGVVLAKIKGDRLIFAASFSPDGSYVVATTEDHLVRVWDARTGIALAPLKGHEDEVISASFSPDGLRVLTASKDKTARVWDARTGDTSAELKGHTDVVISATFSPDGLRVLTASKDKTARVWDARTGVTSAELKGHTGEVISASFSPDGSRVLTASKDKTARVWDARTGVTSAELKDLVHWASFSADGSRGLTVSGDGTARVWDARTGVPIAELKGHTGSVRSASFSVGGTRVLTLSGDGTARVWDARTGVPIAELKGHTDDLISGSFSTSTVSLDS